MRSCFFARTYTIPQKNNFILFLMIFIKSLLIRFISFKRLPSSYYYLNKTMISYKYDEDIFFAKRHLKLR